jgi:hypothetical protein
MSETVSQALFLTGGKEAFETAYFIGKIDKLFDRLNIMSICGAKKKRKVFQNPYRSATDFRVKVHVQCHIYICTYTLHHSVPSKDHGNLNVTHGRLPQI